MHWEIRGKQSKSAIIVRQSNEGGLYLITDRTLEPTSVPELLVLRPYAPLLGILLLASGAAWHPVVGCVLVHARRVALPAHGQRQTYLLELLSFKWNNGLQQTGRGLAGSLVRIFYLHV